MDRGKCSGHRIADQYRNAVGGLSTDQNSGYVRNQSVSLVLGIANIVNCLDRLDRIAVNLPDGRQPKLAAKNIDKAPAVFVNIFG